MILDVLEHLGVELPLGVVGLGAELAPNVCSGHLFRLEGTRTTGQAGIPASLDPQGSQLLSYVWADGQMLWPPHL